MLLNGFVIFILIFVFLSQFVFWRFLFKVKILKLIFILSILIVFLILGFYTYYQFYFWKNNELSKFLLPPYQSINYFIYYTFFRIYLPYLISLATSLIFLIGIDFLNKKFEQKFFYQEETYLIAISVFLLGYPLFLFYLIFVLSVYFLIHLIYFLYQKIFYNQFSQPRISLINYWLPTAIIIFFLKSYLSSLKIWFTLII